MAVAVSAGNYCWQFYSSGILRSLHGCPTRVDHAVVIVGLEEGPPIGTWKRDCEFSTTGTCPASFYESNSSACGEAEAIEGTLCCCRWTYDVVPGGDVWVV